MKIVSLSMWACVLSFLAVAGCQKSGGPTKEPDDYPIKGKVVSVNPEENTIKLDHEDIAGLMGAMTMNFTVNDPKLLKGLKPGDKVEGRLKKGPENFIITELKKR